MSTFHPEVDILAKSVIIENLNNLDKVPAGLFITENHSALSLQPGDILLRFAGYRVGDTETLQQYLQQYQVGDTVTIVIYRNGQQHQLSLTLEEEK